MQNRDDTDPDGSGASFVVMPLWERRLPTVGQLSTTERLKLVERLFSSLTELHRSDPRFVHGAIRPSSIGLCLATDAPVFALDFVRADSRRAAVSAGKWKDHRCSIRTWPRVLWRRTAEPQSDVFSVGALAYEMLGGDLQILTQALRSRRAFRACRRSAGVPPHIENAILAALRPEPRSD